MQFRQLHQGDIDGTVRHLLFALRQQRVQPPLQAPGGMQTAHLIASDGNETSKKVMSDINTLSVIWVAGDSRELFSNVENAMCG